MVIRSNFQSLKLQFHMMLPPNSLVLLQHMLFSQHFSGTSLHLKLFANIQLVILFSCQCSMIFQSVMELLEVQDLDKSSVYNGFHS